jgi:ketosteroid isomerase-like protein
MSQENVELVRSVYSDPSGLTAGASGKVAPDAEFDFTALYPDRPITRGVEEFRRFRDSGPWGGSPISFEQERFFDVDDERVLVFVRVSATGQGSGAPVEIQVAHEFTIRDELVVRFKVYGNRDKALEAAGLSEQARTEAESSERLGSRHHDFRIDGDDSGGCPQRALPGRGR